MYHVQKHIGEVQQPTRFVSLDRCTKSLGSQWTIIRNALSHKQRSMTAVDDNYKCVKPHITQYDCVVFIIKHS